MLRQQLDALSRLAIVALSLIDAPAPVAGPRTLSGFSASALRLQRAVRLQARVSWALRLIEALRAKLLADLHALESGQAPAPPIEARSFAAAAGAFTAAERPEHLRCRERPERPERLERERFGFEPRGSDKRLAEILKLPTEQVIALICRELGLPADWPRLAEEAWVGQEGEYEAFDPSGSAPRGPLPGPSSTLPGPS